MNKNKIKWHVSLSNIILDRFCLSISIIAIGKHLYFFKNKIKLLRREIIVSPFPPKNSIFFGFDRR